MIPKDHEAVVFFVPFAVNLSTFLVENELVQGLKRGHLLKQLRRFGLKENRTHAFCSLFLIMLGKGPGLLIRPISSQGGQNSNK